MKTITTLAALAAFAISSITSAAPVNINTASASEIAEALNGIGLSKAQAIVEYREAYGEFSRADEIVFVRGIGESTFEKNKSDILVK
ncbi:MAG: helix-hairpin-helix domain-containing protein [Gammaproteobacteria bacterium]|jgi:competence protein ComEA|nr:helix-hairpin-helix domain-containing protein [Gammaproteobacteria bacterium]